MKQSIDMVYEIWIDHITKDIDEHVSAWASSLLRVQSQGLDFSLDFPYLDVHPT